MRNGAAHFHPCHFQHFSPLLGRLANRVQYNTTGNIEIKTNCHKGPGKRGHIVAHDVSWARKRAGHKMNIVFPCCANWETFVEDTKCFRAKSETFFEFVSATDVARAGKWGNICVGNIVSATMCPRLPGP